MSNKKSRRDPDRLSKDRESHPFSEELSDGGERNENIKKLSSSNHNKP
ncbi:hypothetical protein [Salirhabdus sp. Marseille-P4669]|nr:hypothetical protein [Salirhabdus sp. Marseille-P4669]